MYKKTILIAVLFFALFFIIAGCGGLRTYNPVSYVPQLAEQKQWAACYHNLEDSLLSGSTNNTSKALKMIEMHPEILSIGLLGHYDNKRLGYVTITCDPFDIKQIFERLTRLKKLGYCSEEQFKYLVNNLKKIAISCVESAEEELILDDLYYDRCDIYNDGLLFILFKRQIEKSKHDHQLINHNVKAYIKEEDCNSEAELYLFNALPEIKWITSAESRRIIKSLFPDYYKKIVSRNKITLFVKTDPTRPLLEMDIIKRLDAYEFIDCFKENKSSSQQGLLLSINELVINERQDHERTIQQFVPWHKMSAFSAVLAYPENSTAIYDLTSGGCSISFAYQIILTEQGEIISDDILRDKEEAKYQYASNLRFKNVFGGVGVPSAYPNNYVKTIFENSSSSIDLEELKDKVFHQLLQRITCLEKIDDAASLE